MPRAWPLLLLAVAASGAEDARRRGAAATALLRVDDGSGTVRWCGAAIVDRKRGLLVTVADAVASAKRIEVRTLSGADPAGSLHATVAAARAVVPESGLALLETPPFPEEPSGEPPLAPPLTAKEPKSGDTLSAVVHFPGAPDGVRGWTWLSGTFEGTEASPVAAELRLLLLRHSVAGADAFPGGTLFDGEGRLLGLLRAGDGREGAGGAVPVNAIRRFLEEAGFPAVGDLPPDALPVRGEPPAAPRERPGPEAAPPPPEAAPEGFPFGPYVHYFRTRAMADLDAKLKRIVPLLRGLHSTCRRCGGTGRVEVVLREGFYIDNVWVPPEVDVRTCETCDGAGILFAREVAERFFRAGVPPAASAAPDYAEVRNDWIERCRRTGERFVEPVRYTLVLEGRFAEIDAPFGHPLFPLRCVLLPTPKGYEWFLHDPAFSGEFGGADEFLALPSAARVEEVYAGDAIRLEDGTIVRLCGIAIPTDGPKLPAGPRAAANPVTRDAVRGELFGKEIGLAVDKYAQFTMDGHAIAFVELAGRDYAEDLLRRGLARLHPRHAHERAAAYRRAEDAARKAKAGCWAEAK